VQFLGQPTEFVSGPAMLASRTNCAIIGIAVVRSAPGRYRILATEVLPGGHNQTDELALTAMCAAELEKAIRLWPEQWAWNYKRWKTIHSPAS
jgi:KDO2-lipid IV(A) lauroyltransferase